MGKLLITLHKCTVYSKSLYVSKRVVIKKEKNQVFWNIIFACFINLTQILLILVIKLEYKKIMNSELSLKPAQIWNYVSW